jgi:hypothetical protein
LRSGGGLGSRFCGEGDPNPMLAKPEAMPRRPSSYAFGLDDGSALG